MTNSLPHWVEEALGDSIEPLVNPDGSQLHEFNGQLPAVGDGFFIGTASVQGQRVFVAANDGRALTGTFGPWHFAALVALFRHAGKVRDPVILAFDTAGVRVQQAALGMLGFRHALHALYEFKAKGGRGVTLVGGEVGCFGAGAQLAICLGNVLMKPGSRLGIAGPRALQAALGSAVFDASDAVNIDSIMGCENRCRTGEAFGVMGVGPVMIETPLTAALGRSERKGVSMNADFNQASEFRLPNGQKVVEHGGVLSGQCVVAGVVLDLAGISTGTALTKVRADRLTALIDPNSDRPLLLWNDAQQVFSVADDRDGLALSYAKLADQIACCRAKGRAVIAFGQSGGSGAAFMVLGMMADAIAYSRSAVCHAVPPNVAKVLLKSRAMDAQATSTALHRIGVIDEVEETSFDETISCLLETCGTVPKGHPAWHGLVERYVDVLACT